MKKLERSFIWGHEQDERKLYMISWEIICGSKLLGDVGLRSLIIMNDTCLLKLAWSFYFGCNDLWAQILRSQYSR